MLVTMQHYIARKMQDARCNRAACDEMQRETMQHAACKHYGATHTRGDARNIMQHVVLSRGQGETWTAALLKKIIANIVVRTLFAALAALICAPARTHAPCRPHAHTHDRSHALIARARARARALTWQSGLGQVDLRNIVLKYQGHTFVGTVAFQSVRVIISTVALVASAAASTHYRYPYCQYQYPYSQYQYPYSHQL